MNGRSETIAAVAVAPSAGADSRTGTISWRGYTAAACSGPLIAAGFLAPSLYPLAWVSFVPLLWVLRQAKGTREVIIASALAGFITNFLGFYWLMHTMHVFGGFPMVVSVFFYVCLTAYSTGQFVLFGLGVRRLGFALLGLAPALLWTALEFLYLNLFPWRMANSQFPVPLLIQVGDLGGPFALSLAILWVNAGIVLALALARPRRFAPLLAAAGLVGAIALYGAVRMPQIEAALRQSTPLRVGLIQGNVSIEQKKNAAFFQVNVEQYRDISRQVQDKVDLMIWPETVAQWWTPADAAILEPRLHPLPGLRTYLVYGGLSYRYLNRDEVEAFNSAFLVGPGDALLGRYDKHILMPFGEYLPGARLLPFVKRLSPQSGDFTPGRGIHTFAIPGAVLGPLICYEDVVSGIPRRMTRAGAQILFNILNDAWFGDSAGPHEHQALALWRAVENRRYLLRASNSGVTSIIDPLGRVVSELGTFRADVLIGEVRPLSLMSIYTRYGDVFGWSVVAAVAALLVMARLRVRS